MTPEKRPENWTMIRLAQWLGVIAVLVRCVFSPGLMPDIQAAARGELKLVICTGGGAKVLPGDERTDDKPHAGDGMCPFSVATHFAVPSEAAILSPTDFRPALSAIVSPRPLPTASVANLRARAPPIRS